MEAKNELIDLLKKLGAKLDKYMGNPDLLRDSTIMDLSHFEKSKSALHEIIHAVQEDLLNREQSSLIISRLINEWYPEDVQEALRDVNVFYRTRYKIRQ